MRSSRDYICTRDARDSLHASPSRDAVIIIDVTCAGSDDSGGIAREQETNDTIDERIQKICLTGGERAKVKAKEIAERYAGVFLHDDSLHQLRAHNHTAKLV